MGNLWLVTAGLLLLSCGCVSSSSFSSSSSSGRPFPQSHDLSFKEMQDLLGQPVKIMRMMERPLEMTGGDKIKNFVSHSGVEVVTEDGRRFLIHKGRNFGRDKGGNTVVVDAKHMSKKWTPASNWKVPNEKIRVTDMVKAGGKDYNEILANCHDASKSMMYGDKKIGFKPIFLKPQVPKGDRIPKAGNEGSRRGHEGSRRGHESSRRGHESSRKGHEGSRRGHEGSRRGYENSRGGYSGRTGGFRGGYSGRTGGFRGGYSGRTGGFRGGYSGRTGGFRGGYSGRAGGFRRG